jgi:hypothetical protein
MAEQKHTSGALHTCGGYTPHYRAIADEKSRYIVFSMADCEVDLEHGNKIDAPSHGEQFANASRLVACWNACEGIADPSVIPEALELLARARAVIQAMRPGLSYQHEWNESMECSTAIGHVLSRLKGTP